MSSGTTVTVAYHPRGQNQLYVAHCGDSRLAGLYKDGTVRSFTRDHRPEDAEERTVPSL